MESLLRAVHQWRSSFVGQRRGSVRRHPHPSGDRLSVFGVGGRADRVQGASNSRITVIAGSLLNEASLLSNVDLDIEAKLSVRSFASRVCETVMVVYLGHMNGQ